MDPNGLSMEEGEEEEEEEVEDRKKEGRREGICKKSNNPTLKGGEQLPVESAR
jgi:hypothetical protein